jgi:hypothetical protein
MGCYKKNGNSAKANSYSNSAGPVLPEEKMAVVKKMDVVLDQQMMDHMNKFIANPNPSDLEYLYKLVTIDMYCDKFLMDHGAMGNSGNGNSMNGNGNWGNGNSMNGNGYSNGNGMNGNGYANGNGMVNGNGNGIRNGNGVNGNGVANNANNYPANNGAGVPLTGVNNTQKV